MSDSANNQPTLTTSSSALSYTTDDVLVATPSNPYSASCVTVDRDLFLSGASRTALQLCENIGFGKEIKHWAETRLNLCDRSEDVINRSVACGGESVIGLFLFEEVQALRRRVSAAEKQLESFEALVNELIKTCANNTTTIAK